MGPATKPDQKRRLGFLTGLRLCEAIEREFPELSRWKVIRILDIVINDLHAMIPASREAKVVKSLVLKEKNATIAPDLRSLELRPTAKTPIANFFLAGDWIQTGLPATIESAVISGRAAAASVIARAGQ